MHDNWTFKNVMYTLWLILKFFLKVAGLILMCLFMFFKTLLDNM